MLEYGVGPSNVFLFVREFLPYYPWYMQPRGSRFFESFSIESHRACMLGALTSQCSNIALPLPCNYPLRQWRRGAGRHEGRCNRSLVHAVMAISPLSQHHEEYSDHIGLWGRMENTRNQTRRYLLGFARTLPEVRVLTAVNGFNYTGTIEALLHSELPFRNLSRSGMKWGVLATFLTHYRALQYQVNHRISYQITLEEDLHVRRVPFLRMTEAACALLERNPDVDLLQLSHFGEVRLTSLRGAKRLINLLRGWGILKNIDQQLFDPAVMGHCHRVLKVSDHLQVQPRSERPFILGRHTNGASGHTFRSRQMTWAEVALLRLISDPPAHFAPSYGNPAAMDYRTY